MKYRRSHKRPDHRRDSAPFFTPTGHQKVAPTTPGFFSRAAQEESTAISQDERKKEQSSQSIDDRDLARQDERKKERVNQETEHREEETARQADEREEEASARQEGEREEETARQADEREEEEAAGQEGEREEEKTARQTDESEEEATRQNDKREEETAAQDERRREEAAPSQSAATVSRLRQRSIGRAATPMIQRTIGDGHDLTAPRFAGDLRLEAAFDNERYVRNGARGAHVMRLQQALVELGFQLPGVGVDGRFGSETEQAVRDYQAAHGLSTDGIVGPQTMGDLDRRMLAPSINWPNSLRDRIRRLISGGRSYAQIRPVIRSASSVERFFALFDMAFLREIQPSLAWNDFARIVELLGRRIPDGNAQLADAAVQAALGDAWTDSNPAVTSWDAEDPAHPQHADCSPSRSSNPRAARTGTHEEGGWIYLNIITGGVYTRRARGGGQATLNLANPPQILDSIVVGTFHTHPNLGDCWGVQPGTDDVNFSRFVGVPLLARGMQGGVTQDFVTQPPAPQHRAHLAGPRGYPLAGGGIAPQTERRAAQADAEYGPRTGRRALP